MKILLMGDSCIDTYVYGSCTKVNLEAPIPILDLEEIKETGGMADNVYKNLKSFGLDVDFLTNIKKTRKVRFIDSKNGQQILRLDYGSVVEKCDISTKKISKYDVIVISDYNKGFITKELLFKISKLNKIVFVDSKKTELPKNGCFIKINKNEYEKLINKDRHKNIIVTQGSLGASYNNKLYPSENVKNANIIGAGDTFLCGLVFKYIETRDIEKSIMFANKTAKIAVLNSGTYVLTKKDVNKLNKERI